MAKEYKLDLFKETLPALYGGDKEFYNNCDDEQKKEISPLVLMRWMTLSSGTQSSLNTIMVNELVNIEFWSLSKHPELQWKLLSMIGEKPVPKHTWVAGQKQTNYNKVDSLLLSLYPSVNDMELGIIRSSMTKESLERLMKDLGWTDNEIKPVMEEFKKNQKNK